MNIQGQWDSYKRCNICVIKILEEEKEKGTKDIFETILTENFSKLMSDTKPQIHETNRTSSRINAKNKNQPKKQKKTPIHRHIIFKLQKIKDKERSQSLKSTLPIEEQR